jgi:hypothetical protein
MGKRWVLAAGLVGITLTGCASSSRAAATTSRRTVAADRARVTPLQALRALTPREVARAAQSGNLIAFLRQRWPQIPKTVWTTHIAAVPFDHSHSLPVVVVTHLTGSHNQQDLLTYTPHGVAIQSTTSILSAPLAAENPGLVMGIVDGRPAFLVTSGPLGNRVNLVWWTGAAWRRVWSSVVTTTDQVRIQSVDRFVAGNTPGITFSLVRGSHPQYRPVPSVSSVPYWVIDPKQAALGQPLTIVGSILPDAGKRITLNWNAPTGALVQWTVPIANNGTFRVTETVPPSIDGRPAPPGSYTLSTVLNRWGDSLEVLESDVSVARPR